MFSNPLNYSVQTSLITLLFMFVVGYFVCSHLKPAPQVTHAPNTKNITLINHKEVNLWLDNNDLSNYTHEKYYQGMDNEDIAYDYYLAHTDDQRLIDRLQRYQNLEEKLAQCRRGRQAIDHLRGSSMYQDILCKDLYSIEIDTSGMHLTSRQKQYIADAVPPCLIKE